jgi:hypothetical protein
MATKNISKGTKIEYSAEVSYTEYKKEMNHAR